MEVDDNHEKIVRILKKKFRTDKEIETLDTKFKEVEFFKHTKEQIIEEEYIKLQKSLQYEKHDPHQILLRKGEKGIKYYILIRGKVSVRLHNKQENLKESTKEQKKKFKQILHEYDPINLLSNRKIKRSKNYNTKNNTRSGHSVEDTSQVKIALINPLLSQSLGIKSRARNNSPTHNSEGEFGSLTFKSRKIEGMRQNEQIQPIEESKLSMTEESSQNLRFQTEYPEGFTKMNRPFVKLAYFITRFWQSSLNSNHDFRRLVPNIEQFAFRKYNVKFYENMLLKNIRHKLLNNQDMVDQLMPVWKNVMAYQVGNGFGEIALTKNCNRMATIYCDTEAEFATLSKKDDGVTFILNYQQRGIENFQKSFDVFEWWNKRNWISQLVGYCQKVNTKGLGDFIYRFGHSIDNIYLLSKGEVQLTLHDMNFPRYEVTEDEISGGKKESHKYKMVFRRNIKAPYIFGVEEVQGNCPFRQFDAQCITAKQNKMNCEYFILPKEQVFGDLQGKNPQFMKGLQKYSCIMNESLTHKFDIPHLNFMKKRSYENCKKDSATLMSHQNLDEEDKKNEIQNFLEILKFNIKLTDENYAPKQDLPGQVPKQDETENGFIDKFKDLKIQVADAMMDKMFIAKVNKKSQIQNTEHIKYFNKEAKLTKTLKSITSNFEKILQTKAVDLGMGPIKYAEDLQKDTLPKDSLIDFKLNLERFKKKNVNARNTGTDINTLKTIEKKLTVFLEESKNIRPYNVSRLKAIADQNYNSRETKAKSLTTTRKTKDTLKNTESKLHKDPTIFSLYGDKDPFYQTPIFSQQNINSKTNPANKYYFTKKENGQIPEELIKKIKTTYKTGSKRMIIDNFSKVNKTCNEVIRRFDTETDSRIINEESNKDIVLGYSQNGALEVYQDQSSHRQIEQFKGSEHDTSDHSQDFLHNYKTRYSKFHLNTDPSPQKTMQSTRGISIAEEIPVENSYASNLKIQTKTLSSLNMHNYFDQKLGTKPNKSKNKVDFKVKLKKIPCQFDIDNETPECSKTTRDQERTIINTDNPNNKNALTDRDEVKYIQLSNFQPTHTQLKKSRSTQAMSRSNYKTSFGNKNDYHNKTYRITDLTLENRKKYNEKFKNKDGRNNRRTPEKVFDLLDLCVVNRYRYKYIL